jgi:hypothetical protein
VKGTSRRSGNFSLRDLFPFSVFGRGVLGYRRRRRMWLRLRSEGLKESAAADRLMSERNVLDYRTLDGLRLVFGDIYADH